MPRSSEFYKCHTIFYAAVKAVFMKSAWQRSMGTQDRKEAHVLNSVFTAESHDTKVKVK
jgi:hypothetical protein